MVPALTDQLTSSDCTAGTTVDHGTSCTYMCGSGYTLQGSGTAMCTSGTLTPPTCEGKLKFADLTQLGLKKESDFYKKKVISDESFLLCVIF